MSYTYAVLGSGRQGKAAAYDLAQFGEATQILLCDRDAEVLAGMASEYWLNKVSTCKEGTVYFNIEALRNAPSLPALLYSWLSKYGFHPFHHKKALPNNKSRYY